MYTVGGIGLQGNRGNASRSTLNLTFINTGDEKKFMSRNGKPGSSKKQSVNLHCVMASSVQMIREIFRCSDYYNL